MSVADAVRGAGRAEVAAVAARVGDMLADERLDRRGRDLGDLDAEEEREFARRCARIELGDGAGDADVDAVVARVLGLGRLQPLLEDPEVNDVHARGSDPVWVKLRDGRRERRAPIVDADDELVELVRRAATRMGRHERRFDAGSPELNMQLPDGSRLFAVMDVSARPSLVVRRHRFDLSSLHELEDRGLMGRGARRLLAAAVRARRNVVVAGGTGSGKTTLLRALLNEVPADERIVTIEDAYELGLEHFADRHPDHDALQARPANVEGRGEITLADLTRMALRMDPDRVIVGEVRGAEAFPMLLAMSQGNDGSMCTMHADSTRSVFPKLAAYVAMAQTGLPVETTNLLVASAVHLVVYVSIRDGRRRIASIREVVDADGAQIVSNEVYALDRDGQLRSAYPLREETRRLLSEHGYDARDDGSAA